MIVGIGLGVLITVMELFVWGSIFSITSKESRREEKMENKRNVSDMGIKGPVNWCGEIPISEDFD